MVGAIGAGLGIVTGIAKGIMGKNAHNNYADDLAGVSMTMPKAILEAEGVKKDLAYGNMPGLSDMLGGADAGTASMMTKAKRVATSPGALIDALVESSTEAEASKRDTMMKNAIFKTQNKDNLANFLAGVKAPAEQAIEEFDVNKKISIMKERMLGDKTLMDGIEGGIGGALSAFGTGSMVDASIAKTNAMKGYWGNVGDGSQETNTGIMQLLSGNPQ